MIRRIHFCGNVRIDPVGYSGGIWILWNSDILSVDVIVATSQWMNTRITLSNGCSFLFTGVYAEPILAIREI